LTRILIISTILILSLCQSIHAEKKKIVSKTDSLKAANTARLDSIRNFNRARQDSIKASNSARLEAIKVANEVKRDSMETARDLEKEKRALALEEKKLKQQASKKKKIEPLTQEMAVGFRLNSDGWSFLVNRDFIKTEDVEKPHTNFLWFDLSEKKNPKESRTLNENFTVVNPNELKPVSYKYGKINNFYQLKIGYGASKPITGKLDKKSVTINWVYGAGLSLGMLKPYYLDLLIPEGNVYIRKYDKYTEANKESFLDLNNQGTIIGGSDFTKGISEIKLKPGLALRSGFYFDYTSNRKTFLGVEIGISAEIYTQKIPIMINTSNSAYFLNVYADFRFGKRWE
jgi:hypothetical protein